MRRPVILTVSAAALLAAGFLFMQREESDPSWPRGPEAVECDSIAGPDDDLSAIVAGSGAGDTVCLSEGVHELDGTLAVAVPAITLTSSPGETATVRGRIWIQRGADGVAVESLVLDGVADPPKPSPTVNADRVTYRGNEVTNHHTAICFVLGDDHYGSADRAVIEGNWIHDCGREPATNHEHGIYVSFSEGTEIVDNAITGNADRGVQLYPNADGARVAGNLIQGNGEGLIFGGGKNEASDQNVVEDNVISGSTIRYNLESSWQGPVGVGNIARRNCLWTSRSDYRGEPDGSGIEPEMSEIELRGNRVVDPEISSALEGFDEMAGLRSCAGLDSED